MNIENKNLVFLHKQVVLRNTIIEPCINYEIYQNVFQHVFDHVYFNIF